MKCKDCLEFKVGMAAECSYESCRNDRFDLFNGDDIDKFRKELYEMTGVYVSASSLRKNVRDLKDHITEVVY